jgi:hypothetical protein
LRRFRFCRIFLVSGVAGRQKANQKKGDLLHFPFTIS